MDCKAGESLHVGVLPWIAAGHLTPFYHLCARLALLGHRVSFVSTPSNLRRLPIPLPANIHPVPLHPSLPLSLDNTADLSSSNDPSVRRRIRQGYDSLSTYLSVFIQSSYPPLDWILCDYSPYWATRIARSFGVKTAFGSLFNATVLTFLGPTDELLHTTRVRPEDFTITPKWVPYTTSVGLKHHEARGLSFVFGTDESGTSDPVRFGATIRDCDVVAVRSCVELEQKELELLRDLYKKPVYPVGLFPPVVTAGNDSGEWNAAFEWLDGRERGSAVYVAFGSEVRLKREEIFEIARGLEMSGLPFIWALRRPKDMQEEELPPPRNGMICYGWVPQVRILGHVAVGGFLTHCGWNSVVEGLSHGLALILTPMIFDQPLNARMLAERGIGREVDRDEEFDAAGISKALRLVMVEAEEESYRAKAREVKSVLGNNELQDSYVDQFAEYLKEHRPVASRASHPNVQPAA